MESSNVVVLKSDSPIHFVDTASVSERFRYEKPDELDTGLSGLSALQLNVMEAYYRAVSVDNHDMRRIITARDRSWYRTSIDEVVQLFPDLELSLLEEFRVPVVIRSMARRIVANITQKKIAVGGKKFRYEVVALGSDYLIANGFIRLLRRDGYLDKIESAMVG